MKLKKIIAFIKMTLTIFLFLIIINLISGYFSKRVEVYIEQKTTLETSKILSETIQNEVLPNIDLDNLVKISKNEDGQVEYIFINTYQINHILADTTYAIQNRLSNLNNEDLENLKLPLGTIVTETLFNNLGPDINIKIFPVGSVVCDVLSKNEEYGINNSVLRIDIVVKVNFSTVIPFRKGEIEVVTKIPIVVHIIQGRVPTYYYNNTDSEFIPTPFNID